MADTTFFERVAALRREGRPFAIATVVGRRAPVSAQLGDHALVFADGRMEGFVGGACSREIVRRQALDVLRQRRGRLVAIRPDATDVAAADPDRVVVPMTCASEGAVDVYLEPVVRPRLLVVAGATPVADAVTRLGRAMRYDVVRVVETAEHPETAADAEPLGATATTIDALSGLLQRAADDGVECAAVVATQGHYDEPALEVLLRGGVAYVGLVASRKRGGGVRDWLAAQGTPGCDRMRVPAGLDLGGRTPEEIAVAILGEVVQTLNGAAAASPATTSPGAALPLPMVTAGPATGATAVDPVCHMDVTIATAIHTAEVGGVTYYFCCGGCRTRFLAEPARYLGTAP